MFIPLTAIDLFSGIGGFKIACDRVGIKTLQFVEIDPNCHKVLKKHYPDIPIHNDVTTYHPIRANIIIGGSPCTGNSICGSKKGLTDSRSALWFEQFRIIKEAMPDFAIWENPKGALHTGALARVLNDFHSIGYRCDAEIVSAKEVGLPQLRERIFVVSYSNRVQQAIRGQVLCSWSDQIRDHINQARSFRSPQEPQPSICRVVDGVSDRLQRGRQLGNAVVPSCAVVPLLRVKYLAGLANMADQNRIKTITDEMRHDAENHGLDAKTLRSRLTYYRRQILNAIAKPEQTN